MAWESGFASDYRDLLLRLKEVITGSTLITMPVVSGTGDGVLHGLHTTGATAAETWTITCTNDLVPATFSVVGSVSGAQASATADVPYTYGTLSFIITAGSVDFEVGDSFTFAVAVNPLVAASQVWSVERWSGTGAKVVNYLVSSVYDGTGTYNGEKAVDLSTTTYWSSQVGEVSGAWWQVEFDKPVDIRKFSIGGYTHEWPTNTNPAAPKDFDIAYSDDGISFTVDSSYVDQITWLTGEVREFLLTGTGGAHKFWRINIAATNPGGTAVKLYSLKLFSQPNALFNVAYYGDGYDAVLRGPGTAGGDDIYVAIRPDAYIHNGPNWVLEGSLGYASGLDSLGQPGYSNELITSPQPHQPRLPLFDAPFKYWITVSGRVITVAARFQGISELCQLGFFLPYAMPEQSQYPYPLIIAGAQSGGGNSSYTSFNWQRADDGHSLVFSPRCAASGLSGIDAAPSPVRVYTPYNTWAQVANFYSGNYNWPYGEAKTLTTTPYQMMRDPEGVGSYAAYLGPMLNGKYPLTAICLVDVINDATYGELDGLKHIPGVHPIESIITDDEDQDWLVLNNVFRVSSVDFVAMRLL